MIVRVVKSNEAVGGRNESGNVWGHVQRAEARAAEEEIGSAPKFGTGFKGDFAAGFRCLIPAAPAVPATAAKQQNDKYDDEKRGAIHVELLRQRPCVFSHFAYALPLQPTPLIPIRSHENGVVG
jgi:hypothetical protein